MSPSPTTCLESSSFFEKDVVPHTPMRDSFDVDVSPEATGTGYKTLGSDSSEERHRNHDSPRQPFLAYGRRRRTFSSPFQLNKARYLLSFADEDTAQQWWHLIQSEYPDVVRESPRLFSFESDGVPDKALQNPKFEHLKDKWSYRLVDEIDNKKNQPEDNIEGPGRRTSLASMPTVREDSVISGLGKLEDPFTPNGSDSKSLLDKADFTQLSITSDRIQRSVSQSTLQLDALIEGQEASAKGMQKLQTAVERLTTQMEMLSRRHLEHENALQEFRSASLRDAFSEEPQEEEEEDNATLLSIQSALSDTSARVKELHERRPPTPASPNPSNEILRKLQKEVSQNKTALHSLTANQTATKKTLQKITNFLELTCAEQKLLSAHVRQTQIQSENTHALTQRMAESQNARFDKLEASMAKQAAQSRKQMMEQQDYFKASMNEVLMAVKKSQQPQIVKVNCGHEVFAPPRKLDRKMTGYVYEKA